MKDLFAGLRSAVEDANNSGNATENNSKNDRPAQSSLKKKDTASRDYDLFVQNISQYENKTLSVDCSEEKIREVERKKRELLAGYDADIRRYKNAENDFDNKILAEKKELVRQEEERNKIANELEIIRNSPNDSQFKFKRPQINSSVKEFMTNSFEKKLMSKKECAAMVEPVESVCETDKQLKNMEDIAKAMNDFEESDVCKQLINCIPTDELIKKIINICILSFTGIFFLFVMLGGLKIGFITVILRAVLWIALYPLIGLILTNLIYKLFLSRKKEYKTDSSPSYGKIAIAALPSFLLFAPYLSGIAVNLVMEIVLSSSIVVRLIVGLIIACIAYGVSYGIFSRAFVLNLIRKLPITKKFMLKKLFADCENDTEAVEGMYYFVNSEVILTYYEKNYIATTISYLESKLKEAEEAVKTQKSCIDSVIKRKGDAVKQTQAADAKWKKDIATMDIAIVAAKKITADYQSELDECVNTIKGWLTTHLTADNAPKKEWLEDNWFGDYICFNGTYSRNGIKVVPHSPKQDTRKMGIRVLYNAREKGRLDALAEAIQKTISAFDHIIPRDLVDYTVVDFNMGELGQLYGYDIDWKTYQSNVSGGMGKIVKGLVERVGSPTQAKDFTRGLEEILNNKQEYMRSQIERLREIQSKLSVPQINTRIINTLKSMNPIKYQVVIFIPEHEDESGSIYDIPNLFQALTSLGDGFIPVFLDDEETYAERVEKEGKQYGSGRTIAAYMRGCPETVVLDVNGEERYRNTRDTA